MSIQTVAFIGLGAMGYRMAAHLPKYFHTVWVYNRTLCTAQQHAKQYGTIAVSLKQAVQADVVFSCLPTSKEVEAIILAHPPKQGTVWVDCTSGDPESARRMTAFLAQHGAAFLDAPVSGQTIGAEQGTLTVMIGGDATALTLALPAIQPFSKLIQYVGASGAGFAVKAVNNLLLAANLWAATEGFSVLKAHGVDLQAALACINASSGQSAATSMVLPQRVFNRTFPLTFALDLLAKDTGIALHLAHEAKLPTPVLSLVENIMRTAQLTAPPQSDFSRAVQLYEQWTGVELS